MQLNGILLVDKPQGITSHDVVDVLRKATGIRRIGHSGTLDPRATGLLVMCIGQATRLSQHLSGLDKTYEGAMRLGLVTDSHDLDGKVVAEYPVAESLGEADLQEACNAFLGEIQQVPPMVSAIKIGGRRLYKLAREGQEVERPARTVNITRFEILSWVRPDAGVCVACSSGAYVRTLCHDVGQRLGCGASLAQLRRTRVGNYDIADAAPLDQLVSAEVVSERLVPMGKALDMPEVLVDKARETVLMSGNALSVQSLEKECPVQSGWVQVKNSRGRLIALAVVQPTASGGRIQPKTVFV